MTAPLRIAALVSAVSVALCFAHVAQTTALNLHPSVMSGQSVKAMW